MSGRYEKEQKLEQKIEFRLQGKPAVLTEYYYYLNSSGRTYTTIYNYINYILSFLDFTFNCDVNDDFYKKIKPIHISKYIASLRTKNTNGKTERTSDSFRTVQWSALNTFFQFLVPAYIDSNPVDGTQRPKMKDNPKVTYLTKEEIAALLDNVSNSAQDRFRNRDLCLLKLGFATGLRLSALIQIDIDDIDFKHNQIKVTEKGDYDDYVMFGNNLKEQLMAWIKDRKTYFNGDKINALFISRNGQRISERTVAYLIEGYAKGVTDKKVTPHVMRHSCATNLYEMTNDIYLCSKQLRHKNVTTTQRYAELSKARQKEASRALDGMFD